MPNRLAQEKSPYLIQHADNPVDWYPWGDAAFARARDEQKPIFLSIGYSTCHWCHVMAHESFENDEIAAILNAHFISIKVDREERPDVDRVYMTYVQALTGHGGWPLSAWLTPELKPFYGGTYFPPEDHHGRPGFASVLRAIAQGWATEREKMVEEGERVLGALREYAQRENQTEGGRGQGAEVDLTEPGGEAFEKCFQYFCEAFDAEKGGFGGAPKFPRASNLHFLFRAAALQGTDSEAGQAAVKMATFTLQKMAEGGMHDHVGGGFHRYSVDDAWFVPHFEKMLYDQAQIAVNFLEAYQATRREVFAWQVRDIFSYVLRDLAAPGGAFYSAEDADSALVGAADGAHAKVEGAFYVWTKAEIDRVLSEPLQTAAAETRAGRSSLADFVCAHFGVVAEGNVAPQLDPHGEFRGKNILAQRQSLAITARSFHLDPETASNRLVDALNRLRAVRETRPRPHLDDKIITAWNGLMISALARGHTLLEAGPTGATVYLQAAVRAAEFVRRELRDEASGRLYRSHRGERSKVMGFADDYAFLIQGLIDLYEAGFDVRWLQWAEQLQSAMDALFWDEARGGYYNADPKDPQIVLQLKEDYDGAEPAPGSVAAMNLLRLASFAPDAEPRRTRARRTIESMRPQWSRMPQALPQLLCAFELALETPRQLVLAGDPSAADFRALAAVGRERFGPRITWLAADGAAGQRWLAERIPALAEMRPIDGRAAAYLCQHYTCQQPVTEPNALRALLE